MQRFILLTCLTAFVMASQVSAQQMEDVVHLKNGGLVRGIIIEQIPGESLKIQTRDGDVFIISSYTMDEIAKISKEPVMGMRGHIRAKKKNPWMAFGLSIIPGAGQFYNSQFKKGLTQFGAAIVGARLWSTARGDDKEDEDGYTVDVDDDNWKIGFGVLLYSGSTLWSMIDALISANSINQQSHQPSYGHLIELGGSRATLGVDPVVSHKRLGTRLTLHF